MITNPARGQAVTVCLDEPANTRSDGLILDVRRGRSAYVVTAHGGHWYDTTADANTADAFWLETAAEDSAEHERLIDFHGVRPARARARSGDQRPAETGISACRAVAVASV